MFFLTAIIWLKINFSIFCPRKNLKIEEFLYTLCKFLILLAYNCLVWAYDIDNLKAVSLKDIQDIRGKMRHSL